MSLEQVESNIVAKSDSHTFKGRMSRKGAGSEMLEGIGPGKLRRTLLSKATEARYSYEGAQEQVIPDPGDPLQGVPVILETKGGKWSAAVESGSPDASQEDALSEILEECNAEPNLAIYGEVPRKPGDTWIVDSRKVRRFCGASSLKGPFHVEFLKVEDLDGSPCAVLKLVFDLSGEASTGKGKAPWQVAFKGSALVHRSLGDLTDLKVDLECHMTMEGVPEADKTMTIDGPLKMQTASKLSKR